MTPDHEVDVVREDGFTAVGGVRIHYEAYGAGNPVVLVHGLGASAASWRRLAPFLAEAGYRVLALDLKGCGLSARPPGDYSRKALASLVCGFMDNLGIRRARAVVGHSMGGAIALEIAASRPERLDLVAVVDGQGVISAPWILQAAAPVTPIVGTLASSVTALSPAAPRRFFARMYLKRIFADPSAVTDDLVETYAASADAGYQRAMFAMIQHLGNTADLASRIRTLKHPAVLLWGRHDPVCPLPLGEELQRSLPDAELHVLEDCGHCAPEERPAEVAAHLVDFFARRGPRLPRPVLMSAARANGNGKGHVPGAVAAEPAAVPASVGATAAPAEPSSKGRGGKRRKESLH
ncbi:alpha/beta fold hydrolase [Vulgatibacter incomptus]|uniref:2-hydroxymuconic semialdehyde hydrolase n=1 Tax=Vulgatibacter incomptus TaxID=1391653 RepID=A0A0K1PDK9_9BACT|nr:alpha/beta fold hydrolase [Vulgatibacter incomptus]AKU91628.1 2-hydroxymuconic semialdehyde hydrolase [Vulgatibacter incomptus]